MKEHAVEVFFLFVLIAITLLIGVYLYRVLRGPTVYDRVLGLNGISTKAIILLIVIGTVYGRVEMFVDIATGYALVNLVGSLAIAKYLEERGKSADVSE
jgi:multicomponent Na+:H+ antiporter subunit F|tara:strand:- start:206 stop:502 length:297 start_codon:yes stop_codon:yes gene_type:complete